MSGIVLPALFVLLSAVLINGWMMGALVAKTSRIERKLKSSASERDFNLVRTAVDQLHHGVEDLAGYQEETLDDLRARTVSSRQVQTQLADSVASLERRLDGVAVEVRTIMLEIDRLPGRLADQLTRAQIRQAAARAAGEDEDPREEGPLLLS